MVSRPHPVIHHPRAEATPCAVSKEVAFLSLNMLVQATWMMDLSEYGMLMDGATTARCRRGGWNQSCRLRCDPSSSRTNRKQLSAPPARTKGCCLRTHSSYKFTVDDVRDVDGWRFRILNAQVEGG